jgi:hypothetical protein
MRNCAVAAVVMAGAALPHGPHQHQDAALKPCLHMLRAPAHAQSTSCPVCTAEGVDTTLGPDPLRDQLRVDFMITDLLRKVPGQLEC